ncbi:MAG: HEAT repeat domain-containing protein [Bacteroidales bacterium]|nr:HEAT repeat domain-containing protein [Bacteroidales bacterium]
MNDKDLYRELGTLTKRKEEWQGNIAYVGSLLENQSPKITAKALWLLGEMGLLYPEDTAPYTEKIASFLNSQEDILRERALNALGRIGRARFETVKPYMERMFSLATDDNPRVRLAFIWASENIATNTPDAYESNLPLFAELLHDQDDKVRMEAPEMFRVMGKQRPQWVKPYLEELQRLAENDPNPVVRIHCAGAIRGCE